MDKKKKKLLIIIAIIIATLAIGTSITLVLINKNKQAKDLAESIPTPAMIDSTDAFFYMKKFALEWAPDVQYLSCSGVVTPYEINGKQIYVGGEDGKMPTWSCFIYSKSLKQDATVRWMDGTVYLDGGVVTWGQTEFEADPDVRNFFNPEGFVNSEDIYTKMISSGLDFNSSYITYNFGLSDVQREYGNTPVWQVNEYSRSKLEDPTNEYSQGLRTRVSYLDGISGNLLKSTDL